MSDSRWYNTHQLVHYTKSPEAVSSILSKGFILVPNKRYLITRLLNTNGFHDREPQEFGMVSFTELRKEETVKHRETFGDFGIAVTWEWAIRNSAQRVLYVGEGPVLNTLSWLFQFAKQELERYSSEQVTESILNNKVIASFYSQMYAHLLTLYEFMEPERNSSQVEWRIVNKVPTYHDIADRDKLISQLHSLAEEGMCTVKIKAEDISMLICPSSNVSILRRLLPPGFQNVPIVPYAKLYSLIERLTTFVTEVKALLLRCKRTVYCNVSLPENAIVLYSKSKNSPWYQLPPMATIRGFAFYPDDVLNRALCNVQYESPNGSLFDLGIPLIESLKLLNYLCTMTHEPQMSKLIEIAKLKHTSENEKYI